MTLAKYISDLLYRYDCVIVPNFGGFVANKISAKVNHYTHTFYAPTKQLTFNAHLKNNDGLLANYIATAKSITYVNAVRFIETEVAKWQTALSQEELELENIGNLYKNEDNAIIFEPVYTINYLTSSFGLDNYVSPAIKRFIEKNKAVIPIHRAENSKEKTPAFIKYAAAAVLVFALGTVGWKQYQNYTYNNLVAQSELQQQKVDKTIQEATFIISNPLPAITLNVAKKTHNYHIIAGAFREPTNATKKLRQLLKKGYHAKILGINKWNLTQVAYESFDSRRDAINKLNAIRRTDSKDAWLLIQEY
ncbi:SPOR domain-containing protein [Lutibacter sp.]|uniref:HU domain-containing protein n=1 Tax=Lutibacter sp. TaxID=1925666 RepID=UPI0025C3F749|nr:SPOR domain-containing protein [Lutibacter sp.]MCF6182654.1 SPOR domain-containing protein [Lutibacter sp.]